MSVLNNSFLQTAGRTHVRRMFNGRGKGGSDSGYVQRQETSNIESFTLIVLTLLYINDSAYGLIEKNRES